MKTCMPSSNNVAYMLTNLVGEVGEFSSKMAKAIRKGNATIDHNRLEFEDMADVMELNNALMYEAGDILWQLSGLCTVMGWSLDDVAYANINKLMSRQNRGVIDGEGDNR